MKIENKVDIKDTELYRQELVKSFHQQFAVNQNNHQTAFIQLISIILTVIVGFGYAYFKYDNDSVDFSIINFTVIFSIAEGILTIGLVLVLSYAFGFRRDQLVNAKIREKAGITEDKVNDERWKIFPVSYNPRIGFFNKNKKYRFITWMPDFHIIFTITFTVLQLMLVFLYSLKSCNYFFYFCKIDGSAFVVFGVGIIFIITSFCISRVYFIKIKKLYKNSTR